jgi:hypothetical protein
MSTAVHHHDWAGAPRLTKHTKKTRAIRATPPTLEPRRRPANGAHEMNPKKSRRRNRRTANPTKTPKRGSAATKHTTERQRGSTERCRPSSAREQEHQRLDTWRRLTPASEPGQCTSRRRRPRTRDGGAQDKTAPYAHGKAAHEMARRITRTPRHDDARGPTPPESRAQKTVTKATRRDEEHELTPRLPYSARDSQAGAPIHEAPDRAEARPRKRTQSPSGSETERIERAERASNAWARTEPRHLSSARRIPSCAPHPNTAPKEGAPNPTSGSETAPRSVATKTPPSEASDRDQPEEWARTESS